MPLPARLVDEPEKPRSGSMYAVVRTGGKQYRVMQGDLLKVEKLEEPVGATIALEVLAVGEGEGIQIGTPTVGGARVEAQVVSHGKHRKLWHFRTQEEGWDRIRGHRQPYTELKITGISG
jgi:large subunit ribosomal protein L21